MRKPFTLEEYKARPDWKVVTRCGASVRILCTDKISIDEQPILALVNDTGVEFPLTYNCNGRYFAVGDKEAVYDLFLVEEEKELVQSDIAHSIFSSIVDAVDCDHDTGRILANRCASLIKSYLDGEKETLEGESLTMWEEDIFKLIRQYKECVPFTIGNVMADAKMLLDDAKDQLRKDGYIVEKHNELFDECVAKIDDKLLPTMQVEYGCHTFVRNGHRHAELDWQKFQKVAKKFYDMGKEESFKEGLSSDVKDHPLYQKGHEDALKDFPRWEKYPHNAGSEPLVNGILQKDGSYKWRLYLDGYIIEISDLEKLPGFKED